MLDHGDIEGGIRLTTILSTLWRTRAHLSEAQRWVERALRDAEGVSPPLRGRVLIVAGALAQAGGDYERAEELYRDTLTLYEHLGHTRGIADALHRLGALALYQADWDRALALGHETLIIERELQDAQGVAYALRLLGAALLYRGDCARAVSHLEESRALFRHLGNITGMISTLHLLGHAALDGGSVAKAVELFKESLVRSREVRDPSEVAISLEGLARTSKAQDQATRAVRLYAAAESWRKEKSVPLAPGFDALRESSLDAARAQLGATAFSAAWQEGRGMGLEEAIAYALAEAPVIGQVTSGKRIK
jgi:tetratricopeptide (TPR) repeat protein